MILKLLRHQFFVIFSCGAYCSILLPLNWCQMEISVSSSNTRNLDYFFSTEDFGLFSILTVGVCHQRNCIFCLFLLLPQWNNVITYDY